MDIFVLICLSIISVKLIPSSVISLFCFNDGNIKWIPVFLFGLVQLDLVWCCVVVGRFNAIQLLHEVELHNSNKHLYPDGNLERTYERANGRASECFFFYVVKFSPPFHFSPLLFSNFIFLSFPLVSWLCITSSSPWLCFALPLSLLLLLLLLVLLLLLLQLITYLMENVICCSFTHVFLF